MHQNHFDVSPGGDISDGPTIENSVPMIRDGRVTKNMKIKIDGKVITITDTFDLNKMIGNQSMMPEITEVS